MSFTLPSHAKTNLFLRIPGKRNDGFHEIFTLMLPIGLTDDLYFSDRNDAQIRLECSNPHLPVDGNNLIRKAAELLQSRYAPKRGATIRLKKRIPIGAGLGGGSSNGSTTLVGLNRLWNLNLSLEALEKLSAEFGSDTAFFIRNRPALCKGRGEILTPMPIAEKMPILLMNFGFGSATAWAYRHLHAPPLSDSSFEENLKPFINDLEAPVFKKFPILQISKKFLLDRPEISAAMMCGSGSTMMAILKNETESESLKASLWKAFGDDLWIWTGRTLSSEVNDKS